MILMFALLYFFILVISTSTPEKEAQLVDASKIGNLVQVKNLLDSGTDVDAADSDQATALYWAGKSMTKHFL